MARHLSVNEWPFNLWHLLRLAPEPECHHGMLHMYSSLSLDVSEADSEPSPWSHRHHPSLCIPGNSLHLLFKADPEGLEPLSLLNHPTPLLIGSKVMSFSLMQLSQALTITSYLHVADTSNHTSLCPLLTSSNPFSCCSQRGCYKAHMGLCHLTVSKPSMVPMFRMAPQTSTWLDFCLTMLFLKHSSPA